MLVLVEPDPGSPPDVKAVGAYLDLWHGKCRSDRRHGGRSGDAQAGLHPAGAPRDC